MFSTRQYKLLRRQLAKESMAQLNRSDRELHIAFLTEIGNGALLLHQSHRAHNYVKQAEDDLYTANLALLDAQANALIADINFASPVFA